eukprot:4680667-Ditylum_brightwellii.AAC.1
MQLVFAWKCASTILTPQTTRLPLSNPGRIQETYTYAPFSSPYPPQQRVADCAWMTESYFSCPEADMHVLLAGRIVYSAGSTMGTKPMSTTSAKHCLAN